MYTEINEAAYFIATRVLGEIDQRKVTIFSKELAMLLQNKLQIIWHTADPKREDRKLNPLISNAMKIAGMKKKDTMLCSEQRFIYINPGSVFFKTPEREEPVPIWMGSTNVDMESDTQGQKEYSTLFETPPLPLTCFGRLESNRLASVSGIFENDFVTLGSRLRYIVNNIIQLCFIQSKLFIALLFFSKISGVSAVLPPHVENRILPVIIFLAIFFICVVALGVTNLIIGLCHGIPIQKTRLWKNARGMAMVAMAPGVLMSVLNCIASGQMPMEFQSVFCNMAYVAPLLIVADSLETMYFSPHTKWTVLPNAFKLALLIAFCWLLAVVFYVSSTNSDDKPTKGDMAMVIGSLFCMILCECIMGEVKKKLAKDNRTEAQSLEEGIARKEN